MVTHNPVMMINPKDDTSPADFQSSLESEVEGLEFKIVGKDTRPYLLFTGTPKQVMKAVGAELLYDGNRWRRKDPDEQFQLAGRARDYNSAVRMTTRQHL